MKRDGWRGIRRTVVGFLSLALLGTSPAAADASIPDVAGTTVFRSTGTTSEIVRIPSQAYITTIWEIPIERSGLFAGLLLEQLDVEQGREHEQRRKYWALQIDGSVRCGYLDCSPIDAFGELILGVDDPWDRMRLPAGDYRVTLLAEQDRSVTATMTFEGLVGSVDLTFTRSSTRWSASLADDSLATGDGLDATYKGGTQGVTPPGESLAIFLNWVWVEVGAKGPMESCMGAPGSSIFDAHGYCAPDAPRYRFGERSGISTRWFGLIENNCWSSSDERCPAGEPVRWAYEDKEITGVNHGAGGLVSWMQLEPWAPLSSPTTGALGASRQDGARHPLRHDGGVTRTV